MYRWNFFDNGSVVLKEESIKLRIDDPPRKHATKQHLQPFCKKPPNYQLPASTMKTLKVTKTSFYGNSKMTDYNQNSKSDKIILPKNANNSKEKLSSTTTLTMFSKKQSEMVLYSNITLRVWPIRSHHISVELFKLEIFWHIFHFMNKKIRTPEKQVKMVSSII